MDQVLYVRIYEVEAAAASNSYTRTAAAFDRGASTEFVTWH